MDVVKDQLGISEAFAQLPADVQKQAIENMISYPEVIKEKELHIDSKCRSICDAIASFKWEVTPEGLDYWLNQYMEAKSKHGL